MNILYLAHRIPYPPNKGDKIRSFHQIRHLAREHTVHLACLVDERADLQHVLTLQKYCASIDAVYREKTVAQLLAVLALFAAGPLSVASFYSKELQERLDRWLASGKIDRILVFSSVMAEYVQGVSGIPKVMDFVDVDSEKWRLYATYHQWPLSWAYRLEAERLARYEEKGARAFDHSIFVSDMEANLLRCRLPDAPVSVIPNGVDLEYFHPSAAEPSSPVPPVVVFTGAMDYFPNVDAVRYFCGAIFPRIRQALPAARFAIVGRNPSRQVRELRQQPQVIVTGSVPDVRPYLAEAGLAVAPLRIARGVQNKILEAMAMGLPVVGTPEAFQGMQATAADGIRIADGPEQFAREVLGLLQDPQLHRQCSRQARQYVQRHHRWQDQGARLEALLQGLRQSPPPKPAAACTESVG